MAVMTVGNTRAAAYKIVRRTATLNEVYVLVQFLSLSNSTKGEFYSIAMGERPIVMHPKFVLGFYINVLRPLGFSVKEWVHAIAA